MARLTTSDAEVPAKLLTGEVHGYREGSTTQCGSRPKANGQQPLITGGGSSGGVPR
jgi:hypothetical protein